MNQYLVLGSTGEIGKAICVSLDEFGEVTKAPRDLPFTFDQTKKFNGVVWAQGANMNDSIEHFSLASFKSILDANVTYTLNTLDFLLRNDLISEKSNLVIVGSIWSQIGRPNKLSYSISKSALTGLVRSVAIDLASRDMAVNLVSPGPIESPMTSANLGKEMLNRIVSEIPSHKLVTMADLTKTICTLVTGGLPGVTGAEIFVDGGWSISKLV